jgi:drug/metabolite transporter (DMT)-like permease
MRSRLSLRVAVGRRAFNRLPAIFQAVGWMVLAGATGGLMNVVIRIGTAELDPLQVVFFRNLFALVFLVPWIARSGVSVLRTSKIGFYTLRAVVAFISMITWFIGISLVPLSTATSLNFTAPLFATMGAALILKETVRARRWTAIAVGFLGVIVILRPFGPLDANMLLILASAATAAMGAITVKFLLRTETPAAVVTYMVLYLTPVSLIPALFVWTWPTPAMWGWMVVLGLFGVAAHLCMARALSVADASAVAPFEFMRLPYAAFLGWAFFGETTDAWTWAGAAIIAGSSAYVAHREAKLARDERVSRAGARAATVQPH